MPSVGVGSYYRTVCMRAWRDTAAFLKAQILFNLIVALIVAVVTYWISADIGEPFNVKVAAYAAFLAALVVTAGAFLWNVIDAQWRMYQEQLVRLQAFERRPDTEPLLALRADGIKLLNSDDEWDWLEIDLLKWEQDTITELEKYAARSDASWFKILGQFPLKDFQGKSPEINHAKSMLAERLDRLLVIIRRIEGIG
jgi:hypothetical protein